MKTIKYLMLILLYLLSNSAFGQLEMQGSQFIIDRTYLNPAFTGTDGFFNGNLHFQTNSLGQGQNSKDYGISAGGAIQIKSTKTAIGFNLVKNAFGNDSYTMGYGNFAYHLPLSEKVTLSSGASLGVQQFNINLIRLVTVQENDPALKNNIYSSKMGARWGLQTTIDKKYYAGVSFDNLLTFYTKKDDYYNQIPPTFRRINMYLIGGVDILYDSGLLFQPSILFINNFGGTSSIDINTMAVLDKRIGLGLGLRQDIEEFESVAIGGHAETYKRTIIRTMLRYQTPTAKNNLLKISYGFNFNPNTSAGLSKNSHELSLALSIFR